MARRNPRSYVSRRLWLFQSQIVTSQQLDRTGAHRLRAILLGNFWADSYEGEQVMAEARNILKRSREKAKECGLPLQTWIIWGNVKSACNFGKQSTFHLSDDEVASLKNGKIVTFKDKLGQFDASLAKPKA